MILLDVAIGLTFLFVILGLFLTIFQELIASLLGTRSKNLRTLIERLCQDDAFFKQFLGHTLIQQLLPPSSVKRTWIDKLRRFLLRFGDKDRAKFPSYISAERFTDIVIDIVERVHPQWSESKTAQFLIAAANQPLEAFRKALAELPQDSGFTKSLTAALQGVSAKDKTPQQQLDALRAAIGGWFDDSMDRAAGWYKRRAQSFIFGYAFLLSALLCVDTIHVARTLYDDPELARAVSETAEQYVDDIAESEAATGYLTLGSPFVGTMLTIAELDRVTWQDPQATAAALADHLEGLKFLQEHAGDDATTPGGPADCTALTRETPAGLVVACLVAAIEDHLPREAAEAPEEAAAPAEGGAATGMPAGANQTTLHPFPTDKTVVVPAIFTQLEVLRERAGLVTVDALSGLLDQAAFPIGWDQWFDRIGAVGDFGAGLVLVLQTLFGMLLTALAASLGAPFWFDLLNKFIKLRGSGLIPDRGVTPVAPPPPDGQREGQPAS